MPFKLGFKRLVVTENVPQVAWGKKLTKNVDQTIEGKLTADVLNNFENGKENFDQTRTQNQRPLD